MIAMKQADASTEAPSICHGPITASTTTTSTVVDRMETNNSDYFLRGKKIRVLVLVPYPKGTYCSLQTYLK